MECFKCRQNCPTQAIEIKQISTCIRLLDVRHPISIIEEKCNKCGQCDEFCPMGDITLSAEGCSFCIVCKNRPNCILPNCDRVSFPNLISSIARLMILTPRFIF